MRKNCSLWLMCIGIVGVLLGQASVAYALDSKIDATKIKHYPKANVHEYTLKNGLKVLVKEDHRAPVFVSQVWYKVGSSYEVNGKTGVSHVLEHMMFKGTKAHAMGEFSRIIAANGGRDNAFTGHDYTGYHQMMEKSRLAVSFALEADRMRGVILDKDEFAKELKVVMEERRMRTDDDPQSVTYEHFNSVAYINSPYHSPIIGWMDDLKNMQVEDLREWYDQWYRPNNATVVVVGDLIAAEVFALAEQYFGKLVAKAIPQVKPRKEIPQLGERRIVIKAPAQVPYLLMGYPFPSLANATEAWEPYAIEVMAGILDGGASARFAKHLVRDKQIATSVGAGYDLYTPHQELFLFDGTPAQGHDVKDLEAAIKAQIERIKKELVTVDELDRIKAQVVAGKVYERDSVFYEAMQIGRLETIGLGWLVGQEYVEKIMSVTAGQIQQVAQKYFVDDRLTVAVLEPQPMDPTQPPRQSVGGSRDH